MTDNLTVNYGLRFDAFSAFAHENQLSPRVNLVWKPTDSTTIHAGYARYFSPPPFELVATTTSRSSSAPARRPAAHRTTRRSAERANYFDVGVQQKIGALTLGLDAYLQGVQEPDRRGPVRRADHPDAVQLSQGGGNMAAKFTANYAARRFTAYANASSEGPGKNIVSSQFNFDPGDLAYIADQFIYLDHDQTCHALGRRVLQLGTGRRSRADLLYGSGLRKDGAVPNGDHVPGYVTVNLGVSQDFTLAGWRPDGAVRHHQPVRQEL